MLHDSPEKKKAWSCHILNHLMAGDLICDMTMLSLCVKKSKFDTFQSPAGPTWPYPWLSDHDCIRTVHIEIFVLMTCSSSKEKLASIISAQTHGWTSEQMSGITLLTVYKPAHKKWRGYNVIFSKILSVHPAVLSSALLSFVSAP